MSHRQFIILCGRNSVTQWLPANSPSCIAFPVWWEQGVDSSIKPACSRCPQEEPTSALWFEFGGRRRDGTKRQKVSRVAAILKKDGALCSRRKKCLIVSMSVCCSTEERKAITFAPSGAAVPKSAFCNDSSQDGSDSGGHFGKGQVSGREGKYNEMAKKMSAGAHCRLRLRSWPLSSPK